MYIIFYYKLSMNILKNTRNISKNDERPTFIFQNDEEPVRACGILFTYINQEGNTNFLLYSEKKFNKWQIGDIGGKTDICDKCLFDTLRRECKEETNGKLFGNNVKRFYSNFHNLLQNSELKFFYVKKCKYLIVKVIFTKYSLPRNLNFFMNLRNYRFGRFNLYSKRQHYFKWYNNVINNKVLHFRLRQNFDKIFE